MRRTTHTAMKPRFNDALMRPRRFYLTPNNADRLEACPAARVYRGPKQPKSEGNEWGSAVHTFIHMAKTQGINEATDYVDDTYPRASTTCYAIDVDSIPEGLHEIDQYIDVYDFRTWTGEYDEKYMERCSFGRYDFQYEDDRWGKPVPHVVDWKAGAKNIVLPEKSLQIRTYATGELLRAMQEFDEGKREEPPHGVGGSIVNVHSNGFLEWKTHYFTADDLFEHARRLRMIHMMIMETRAEYEQEGVQPEFVAGEHCKWCDLRLSGLCSAPDALTKKEKVGWKKAKS